MNTGALQQHAYLHHNKPFARLLSSAASLSRPALLTCRHLGIGLLPCWRTRTFQRRPADLIARLVFGVPVRTSPNSSPLRAVEMLRPLKSARGKREHIACDGVIFTGFQT
jgi:hypothetical protein